MGGGRDGHGPPEPEAGRPACLRFHRPVGILLIKVTMGPDRSGRFWLRSGLTGRPGGRAYCWLPRCFSEQISGFWASPEGSGPGRSVVRTAFRTAADRSGPVQTTVSTAQRGNCYLIVAQVNYAVDGVLKFWNWTRNGRNHWCHLRDSSERINARLNKAKQ